ncbi:hypothetical protein PPL_10380 [Heterostelium album PN500]|uniref:Uncharacterized protein n=1 Tax=Heterostelium pallidum (strain ATCC 26659 / Pp 5 / PN500) TaxID=670386 RepID=D3BQX7_HETP5|nr:hypothetical protein PPL_10380 [Heterostelium album PN500]EFA76163.1 hypothetical protein PPL_10380 [Heterostelium album PN500]|eukprot:XP_020428297.1 hypothetical protein PPL_10380 [Heterostelium album PN500]
MTMSFFLFILILSLSLVYSTTTTNNDINILIEKKDERVNGGFGQSNSKLDSDMCLLELNDQSSENTTTEERVFPKRCQFLSQDVSRSVASKMSCCTESDAGRFELRVNNIISQMYAPLYHCNNLKTPLNNSGYSVKEFLASPSGMTPDLQSGDETGKDHLLEDVLDSRFYVKLCSEHLAALQCMRCSRDQRSVLGRAGFEDYRPKRYDRDNDPLFYLRDNLNIDGYPFVLCEQYAMRLFNYCQFLNVRETPFVQQFIFNEHSKNHFVGITQNSGLPEGVRLSPWVSQDFIDVFLISNVNCYTRDMPTFTIPKCTTIINNQWSNRYVDAPNDPPPSNDFVFSATHKSSVYLSLIIIAIILNLILT